jgi:hypothetical protein
MYFISRPCNKIATDSTLTETELPFGFTLVFLHFWTAPPTDWYVGTLVILQKSEVNIFFPKFIEKNP